MIYPLTSLPWKPMSVFTLGPEALKSVQIMLVLYTAQKDDILTQIS